MGVDVSSAIAATDALSAGEGSVVRSSALSEMERIFCDVFISNGGNGTAAAIEAGYPEASAHVAACRLLCRKRVADYLVGVCQRFIHAGLAIAIRTLLEAAGDEKALWKDRIKAATCLLEHGGMAAPKGGVQVNVGVAVNGQQAQALIKSVWSARTERMSDIPASMPDNLQQLEAAIEVIEDRGGDQVQGPAAAVPTLPPYSTASPPVSANSCECEVCRSKDAVSEQAERWLKGGGGAE